jgi:four helix bundle protein
MKREPAKQFQELLVWQKAHQLVLEVYRYSATFPKTEIYGLASQLRRAAVSVPANIAEGFKRRHKPDKLRMLNIAQGSLEEARYYLILAVDLQYGPCDGLHKQGAEVASLLGAYTHAIETTLSTRP